MPTTIYFSGSITGGRDDVLLYRQIVASLEQHGHRVFAGSVAATDVGPEGDRMAEQAIFDRDMKGLEEVARAGGVLVAEVSRPSHGVGYEIGAARYLHRMRVVCLYRRAHTTRCSAMLAGDAGIELIEYSADHLQEGIRNLLRALESDQA